MMYRFSYLSIGILCSIIGFWIDRCCAMAFPRQPIGQAVVAPRIPSSVPASVQQELATTYKDIVATLGFIPTFLKYISSSLLPNTWHELKDVLLEPTFLPSLPPKYRMLVGVAVGAEIANPYLVYLHTQLAAMHGATQNEINDAIVIGSHASRWATIFSGLNLDQYEFQQEVNQMISYIQAHRIK